MPSTYREKYLGTFRFRTVGNSFPFVESHNGTFKIWQESARSASPRMLVDTGVESDGFVGARLDGERVFGILKPDIAESDPRFERNRERWLAAVASPATTSARLELANLLGTKPVRVVLSDDWDARGEEQVELVGWRFAAKTPLDMLAVQRALFPMGVLVYAVEQSPRTLRASKASALVLAATDDWADVLPSNAPLDNLKAFIDEGAAPTLVAEDAVELSWPRVVRDTRKLAEELVTYLEPDDVTIAEVQRDLREGRVSLWWD